MRTISAVKTDKLRAKHDELFKKAMENPLVAKEFFEGHLPENIRKIIDFSTLNLEKETFIEENLRSKASDLLFKVGLLNQNSNLGSSSKTKSEGYIYLLSEQQSKPDRFMAFRLFKYMTNIIERHRTLNPNEKNLPLVIPMIFYTGKAKYNVPRNLWDLCKDEEQEIAKEIWTKDYNLINLQEIPDEEFRKRTWAGVMEFFLKNVHYRDFFKKLDQISESIGKITKINIGYNYLELMLTYALTDIDKNDKMLLKEAITAHIEPETGEKLMTSLAEHWYDEGRLEGIKFGEALGIEKGREEGIEKGIAINKIETARNLLHFGLSLDIISESTGLSEAELKKLLHS